VNLPPLRNPFTRIRDWMRCHRAQAEIFAIAAIAIGLIVLMIVITLLIVVRTLR